MAAKPAIVFCFLYCVLGSLLPSALFAGFIINRGSMVFDSGYSAGNTFTPVAAGGYRSLVFKSGRSIASWSSNYYCRVAPPADNNFVAVAAGGCHSIAFKYEGAILDRDGNDYDLAAFPAGNKFIGIAAGRAYSLAPRYSFSLPGDLDGTGSVYSWNPNVFADKGLLPCDLSDFAPLANWLVDCHADPNNPKVTIAKMVGP